MGGDQAGGEVPCQGPGLQHDSGLPGEDSDLVMLTTILVQCVS